MNHLYNKFFTLFEGEAELRLSVVAVVLEGRWVMMVKHHQHRYSALTHADGTTSHCALFLGSLLLHYYQFWQKLANNLWAELKNRLYCEYKGEVKSIGGGRKSL